MQLPDSVDIVLLASKFNPSIITKDWLYHNDVIRDTLKDFVNTPIFSVTETETFLIILDEKRLHWKVKQVSLENLKLACAKLSRIVDLLPHTPYTTMGFNFTYTLKKGVCNINLLFEEKRKNIVKLFSKDYELGANLLFPFDNFSVNFNLSPLLKDKEIRRARLNFNASVKDIESLKVMLQKQDITWSKSNAIMEGLCLV